MGYTVDYDQLADLGEQLATLRHEFDGVEDQISSFEGSLGHGGVADKLRTFATNWSDKRETIAQKLEGVAEVARGAAAAYSETDHGIAGEITEPGGSQ